MDKRQKKLVTNIIAVTTFTVAMVIGFSNVKNIINRSEAMRAIDLVGKEALSYKKNYGSLPSETYVKQFIEQSGIVRLGNLQYRAQWIEFGCDPNAIILAYAERNYAGLVKSGAAVLWLSGKTEWIKKDRFNEILKAQQKKLELRWIQEHLRSNNQ